MLCTLSVFDRIFAAIVLHKQRDRYHNRQKDEYAKDNTHYRPDGKAAVFIFIWIIASLLWDALSIIPYQVVLADAASDLSTFRLGVLGAVDAAVLVNVLILWTVDSLLNALLIL